METLRGKPLSPNTSHRRVGNPENSKFSKFSFESLLEIFFAIFAGF